MVLPGATRTPDQAPDHHAALECAAHAAANRAFSGAMTLFMDADVVVLAALSDLPPQRRPQKYCAPLHALTRDTEVMPSCFLTPDTNKRVDTQRR
eukprot:2370998-Rhodomonas_salina.1